MWYTYDQAHEYFRLIVAFLSFVTVYLFFLNIVLRREHMTRRGRRIWYWAQALVVVVSYGNVAAYRNDYPATGATVALAIVFIGLTASFLWHPEGDEKVPPPRKKK